MALALTLLLTTFGAASAQAGSTLTIAAIAEIANLDAIYAPSSIPAGTAQRLIFDSLARLSPATGEYEPNLAQSWEILDDGARWRFHLTPGVTFHDGSPLTSADVKYTFDVARLPEFESPYQARFDGVVDVIAVDDLTVDVVLAEAVLPTNGVLIWEHYIYPKAVYEADRDAFGFGPIGTGAYKLSSWNPSEMVLVRHDDYFKGQPAIERVVLRIVPEPAARVLGFEAGELDLIMDVAFEDVPRLRNARGVELFGTNPANVQYLGFNMEDPVVGGEEGRTLRHAIAYATNEQSVLALYADVGGAYTKNMLPPGTWPYNEDVATYDYDPERALELFAEAGWTQDAAGALRNGAGEQLTLSIHTTPDRLGMVDAAQILQENLQDVGVQVNIESYEFTTYFQDIRTLNYQLHLARRNDIVQPDELRTYFHSSNIPSQNRMGYANATMDDLLMRGYSEFDFEAREEIYREVQAILAEDLPAYALAATPVWLGANAGLTFPGGMVLGHMNDVARYIWMVRR